MGVFFFLQLKNALKFAFKSIFRHIVLKVSRKNQKTQNKGRKNSENGMKWIKKK